MRCRAALALGALTILVLGGGCDGSDESRPEATRPQQPTPRRPVRIRPYTQPVPILMYHEVRKPPPGTPNPQLFVSEGTFEAQMRFLARQGYHAVTLAQLREAWRGRRALPRRPLVLTFDDGYLSVYRNVVPLLRRLRWPGVLYLTLGNTRAPEGVTRPQVRAMLRAGWELGAHTISHPNMTTLAPAELREETTGARTLLKRWFGVRATDFCYPAGNYDARVIAAVRRAGYRSATTVKPGLATSDRPFELPRVRVEESDGVRGLASTLASLRR